MLPGSCTLMPSSYNLLLRGNDLHHQSFCQSSVPFREVLWLDCILPGSCTLMPSCHKFLLHRHYLHQKSFANSQSFFMKFLGLIVVSKAVVHCCQIGINCCYIGMIFTKIFFSKSSLLFQKVLWLDCFLPGGNTLMPSCYNFLLQRNDLHQKSSCK